MSFHKNIGKKIRIARKELDISQHNLAKLTCYSVPTISQIESGNINISIASLVKIANALQKPLNYFLSENNDKKYSLASRLFSIEQKLQQLKVSLKTESQALRRISLNIVFGSNIRMRDGYRYPLMQALGSYFSAKLFPEPPNENPYMDRFYLDKKKWAFHSQIFFFKENLKQQVAISKMVGPVIQGRSVYENYHIFVKALHELKALTDDEFKLLTEFYDYLKQLVRKPDTIVYIRSDPKKLWLQFSREDRKIFPLSYIKLLHKKYETWIDNFDLSPVITVDAGQYPEVSKSVVKMVIRQIEDIIG